MQLLLKKSPNAGYVESDVVCIVDDSHQWGRGELDTSVFTVVTGVTLTENEKELLLMPDEQIKVPKSVLKLNKLRRKFINRENMEYIGRRRYDWSTNQITRK